MSFNIFSGRFRPKPLPGTSLYSTTTNRSGPTLKYDEQSNNLFTEETFKSPATALAILDKPEYAERQALFTKYRRTNPAKQEKTLFNLSKAVCLQHVESLTPDVLIDLPWHYGKIIWEDLVHATADSYSIFRNFCEVYGHEPDFHPGNRELCNTSSHLPVSRVLKLPITEINPWIPQYIPFLSSDSVAWLVNLTISGGLDVWELAKLNRLQNLVCLTLEFSPANTGHNSLGRLFKSWVTNKLSFQNLKVIRLTNIWESAVTGETSLLGTLESLPNLQVLVMRVVDHHLSIKMYKCKNLYKKRFGMTPNGWKIFCGDDSCQRCTTIVRHDPDLNEISVTANSQTNPQSSRGLHSVAESVIEAQRISGGKRRVILDVSPTSGPDKTHGWIYFYRKQVEPVGFDSVSGSKAKKRVISEVDADEASLTSVPSKRKNAEKTYKAKASKRRDIGSLLSSFS